MDETIKTVRLRPTFDDAKTRAEQSNLTEEQKYALELIKKNAEIEKEKNRSLEYIKTIEQLKTDLIQEQAKTAEMLKKTAETNAEIEKEKNKPLEYTKTIEQLKTDLNQEQAKTAEMLKKTAELEAKVKELVLLEARVTQLTQALARIAEIAAAGKAA